MTRRRTFESIFGPVTLVVDARDRLVRLATGRADFPGAFEDATAGGEVESQLRQYFSRERRTFEIELAPQGSPFQLRVWELLQSIPYGETRSYGQLARELGDPNLSRAVGSANAANPIWIVVPCHRVIGASGGLTGYAGGLDVKRRLLELEGSAAAQTPLF